MYKHIFIIKCIRKFYYASKKCTVEPNIERLVLRLTPMHLRAIII